MPDQVVTEEDEQDEQQEDDESHDPPDDGVVGAGGRRHWAGVWGERGAHSQIWEGPAPYSVSAPGHGPSDTSEGTEQLHPTQGICLTLHLASYTVSET